jgi:hypothetical protein
MGYDFDTVEEALKALKLDKRHKWEEFCGELTYPLWFTAPCSGCDGCGCDECGYQGKRRRVVPIPAFMPNGETVKIKSTTNP